VKARGVGEVMDPLSDGRRGQVTKGPKKALCRGWEKKRNEYVSKSEVLMTNIKEREASWLSTGSVLSSDSFCPNWEPKGEGGEREGATGRGSE